MAFFGPFAAAAGEVVIGAVTAEATKFVTDEVTNYGTELLSTGKIGIDGDMSNFDPTKPPSYREIASAQIRFNLGLMTREKYESIVHFESYIKRPKPTDPIAYTRYINGVKTVVDKNGNPVSNLDGSQPLQGLDKTYTVKAKDNGKPNVYRPQLTDDDIQITVSDDKSAVIKIETPMSNNDTLINKIGQDVGRLIVCSCRNQFEEDMQPQEAFDKAVEETNTQYLASAFLDFHRKVAGLTANLGPEYRQIEQIYNGRNLTLEGNLRSGIEPSGLKIWLLTDEIGTKFTYRQPTGYVALPAFDTWGGPLSPNNEDPTTISGLYYMYHDIDYTNNGYFHMESDFKLISRLDNNLDRMSADEVAFAQVAIKWFSTVGWSLAAVKGKFSSSEDVETVDNSILFYFLQRDGIVSNDVDYSAVSGAFNKGLEDGAIVTMKEQTAVLNPVKRREYIQKRRQDQLIRNLDVYI